METTTRIFWQVDDDGIDGWEAQRNDGTRFWIGGHRDDTEREIFQSLANLSPGMDFGTVEFERDFI